MTPRPSPAPPHRSRDGAYLALLAAGLAVSAANTGNNLLYVLGAILFAALGAAWLTMETDLRRLRVSRQAPGPWQVGTPGLVTVAVRSRTGRLPLMPVEVIDVDPAGRTLSAGVAGDITADGARLLRYHTTPDRRGWMEASAIHIAARHPLWPFRRTRTLRVATRWVVYPRPAGAPSLPPSPAAIRAPDGGCGTAARRGEFHGLRTFHEGDDVRSVHWRRSARTGELVCREFESPHAAAVDLHIPDDAAGAARERCIEEAAFHAIEALRRQEDVSLRAGAVRIPPGRGHSHVDHILRALALLP
jgi:uncharacterized protein (DUF58 family)